MWAGFTSQGKPIHSSEFDSGMNNMCLFIFVILRQHRSLYVDFIMLVDGEHYQSIWLDETDKRVVKVIDQQKLPFFFEIKELRSVNDVFAAIKEMVVRGAPLIGAAGAFGIYLATLEDKPAVDTHKHLRQSADLLISSRPTAVNLPLVVNSVLERLMKITNVNALKEAALDAALEVCSNEVERCRKIGEYGIEIIKDVSRRKNGGTVNILTHCNAGWLACVDIGTVTAPIYLAREKGIPVHVWVDETRPVNQGARLTTWELGQQGIKYTLIPDNTGGHLMQHGMVDLVLTGSDRTTRKGDTANKIGTYLKALAARDNDIPFYVVLPETSFDFSISEGLAETEIEEREPDEVTHVTGFEGGEIRSVRICPEDACAANWGFDVTPAGLITGLITDRGICKAAENDIVNMFPEKFR
jgi:methylthioribose-1-phosphate isomerase